jgi:hypothetical protein
MRKMIDISRRSHKDERESERRKREEEEKWKGQREKDGKEEAL